LLSNTIISFSLNSHILSQIIVTEHATVFDFVV
jgi:hypothetical protein